MLETVQIVRVPGYGVSVSPGVQLLPELLSVTDRSNNGRPDLMELFGLPVILTNMSLGLGNLTRSGLIINVYIKNYIVYMYQILLHLHFVYKIQMERHDFRVKSKPSLLTCVQKLQNIIMWHRLKDLKF